MDDDESVGLTSTGGSSVAVTEGSTTTYTLVLTSQPTASVTVALSSSNATSVTVAGPGMTAAATTTLTFSTSTWNMAQTVTVTGVEETGGNANTVSETVSISYTVSGGDYAAVTLTAQSVAVMDNDVLGITSTASATLALTEGGAAGTYTLVLNTQPTAMVTVALSNSNTTAVMVSPASLSFSATTWSTAQTVTVSSPANSVSADATASISYTVSGGDYDGYSLMAQSVTVSAAPEVSINIGGTQAGSIKEPANGRPGSTNATVTVALSAAAPSGGLTVSLTRTGSATVTSSDFTAATLGGSDPNYTLAIAGGATSATFTVTAVDDSAVELSETIIFTLQSGTGYELGTASAVTVTMLGDPDVFISFVGSTSRGMFLQEGSSLMLRVGMTVAAPAGGVTVSVTRTSTATLTTDFTLSGFSGTDPNYTLTIPAGTTASAAGTVMAVADGVSDPGEDIQFTIQESADYYARTVLSNNFGVLGMQILD